MAQGMRHLDIRQSFLTPGFCLLQIPIFKSSTDGIQRWALSKRQVKERSSEWTPKVADVLEKTKQNQTKPNQDIDMHRSKAQVVAPFNQLEGLEE